MQQAKVSAANATCNRCIFNTCCATVTCILIVAARARGLRLLGWCLPAALRVHALASTLAALLRVHDVPGSTLGLGPEELHQVTTALGSHDRHWPGRHGRHWAGLGWTLTQIASVDAKQLIHSICDKPSTVAGKECPEKGSVANHRHLQERNAQRNAAWPTIDNRRTGMPRERQFGKPSTLSAKECPEKLSLASHRHNQQRNGQRNAVLQCIDTIKNGHIVSVTRSNNSLALTGRQLLRALRSPAHQNMSNWNSGISRLYTQYSSWSSSSSSSSASNTGLLTYTKGPPPLAVPGCVP